MRLAIQIANRLRGEQQSGYLAFMSSSSTIGIGLGCFVLIALLSIMNGFERELKNKLLSVIPHGEIFSALDNGLNDWSSIKKDIESDSRVKFVSPYTQITGLIQNKDQLKPVSLSGLSLSKDEQTLLGNAVSSDAFRQLKSIPNGVILGQSIATSLGVKEGDSITVLIPRPSQNARMLAPKKIKLVFIGTLNIGGDVDNQLGLMNISTASEQLNITSGAQGLRITLFDPFDAAGVVRQYGYFLSQPVYLSNWTRTHGHIFQDIQLVRLVVYIVLVLVIAVACFNVVSTLVMAVKAKQASIAILMSMGATPQLIMRVFLLQGLFSGLTGVVVGSGLALAIVPQLSVIVQKAEWLLGTKVLSSDVYFIDFLPTEMQLGDVITTVGIGIVLSLLASYYPAKRAARVQPAKLLG